MREGGESADEVENVDGKEGAGDCESVKEGVYCCL